MHRCTCDPLRLSAFLTLPAFLPLPGLTPLLLELITAAHCLGCRQAYRLEYLIPVILDMLVRDLMPEADGHLLVCDDLKQRQDDAHCARVVVDSLKKLGLIDLKS
jgi:hypothetical protein